MISSKNTRFLFGRIFELLGIWNIILALLINVSQDTMTSYMTSQWSPFLLELVFSTYNKKIAINIKETLEVLLLHVTNLFRVEIEKFDFLCGKRQFETNWYLSLTLGWRPASSKKLHFSPSPLLWTGFRLITICKRMAKMNFATKRHIFRLIA